MPAAETRVTVIYPTVDVRGQVAEHLRAWTREQDLDREKFRVFVVVPPDSEETDSIREVMGAPDHLVEEATPTDVAMWNAGAAHAGAAHAGAARAGAAHAVSGDAEADWLVFTEGHSPPRPDCLGSLVRWLEKTQRADAGNFAIAHPRDYLMGRLSDRWFSEQQKRWAGEWPRLHRAGFAIRREVFEKMGGFPPYGQFSVPLLSARLHAAGHMVEPIPGAEVLHLDDRTLGDHHFDTVDFVEGECRARTECDPAFFRTYFGGFTGLEIRRARKAGSLRAALVAALRASPRSGTARRWLRLVGGSYLFAGACGRGRRVATAEWITRWEERLLLRLPLPWELRYRWFVRAHRRVVESTRARWSLSRRFDEMVGLGDGIRTAEEIVPEEIGGLHDLESYEGLCFRWTEPLVHVQFRKGTPLKRLQLETRGLRKGLQASSIVVCSGLRSLPPEIVRVDEGRVVIEPGKDLWPELVRGGLTLLIDPLVAGRGDGAEERSLGLPLFRVEIDC